MSERPARPPATARMTALGPVCRSLRSLGDEGAAVLGEALPRCSLTSLMCVAAGAPHPQRARLTADISAAIDAEVLWRPDPAKVEDTAMRAFSRSVGLTYDDYEELWSWSVAQGDDGPGVQGDPVCNSRHSCRYDPRSGVHSLS